MRTRTRLALRTLLAACALAWTAAASFVATEGYFGALASHAVLVTGLSSGTLKVRGADGQVQTWPVSGGFFEISHNKATVLADAIG